MSTRSLVIAVILIGIMVPATYVSSQGESKSAQADNPLAPFERLIGSQWHLEGSYQEFEWGVGERSVRSKSYFVVEGKPKLVSEGVWFWHPGKKQINGAFTAIDMPVVFFEYTTRFEGNTMMNDLRTFAADGSESVYTETWEFTDDSHFEWKLMQDTPEGQQEIMGGTFTKKN